MIAGDEKRERVRGVRFAACQGHESFRRQTDALGPVLSVQYVSGGGTKLKRCWIVG